MTTRPFTPARARKTAELVSAELRGRIIRGELREGDALPTESELCEAFGISKPTLREAFRILESEQLISIRQGGRHGPTVHEPTTTSASRVVGLLLQHRGVTVRDVDVAFEMILPAAVRRVAAQHTKKDVARLRAHVDELSSLANASDDFAAFLERLAELNYLILDLTGNATIAVLGRLLSDIVTLHITAMAREWSAKPATRTSFVEAAMTGCQQLVELIADGEAEKAEAFWLAQLEIADRRAVQFPGADNLLDLLD
jgi:DNA-binding FadR family transcriptional regulator